MGLISRAAWQLWWYTHFLTTSHNLSTHCLFKWFKIHEWSAIAIVFQTLYIYIYIVYLFYGIAICPTNISNMGPGFSLFIGRPQQPTEVPWCGRQAAKETREWGSCSVWPWSVTTDSWADWLSGTKTAWWFGTWLLFSIYLEYFGIIIPTD